jgi:phage tail protein X
VVGFSWSYRTSLFQKTGTAVSPDQSETVQPKLPEVNTQQTLPEVNTGQILPEKTFQATIRQPLAVSKQETSLVEKTVVRGDTLTKLANEVYGKSDGEVLGLIRDKNPQIADPNFIHVGSTIIFPDLPKQKKPGSP